MQVWWVYKEPLPTSLVLTSQIHRFFFVQNPANAYRLSQVVKDSLHSPLLPKATITLCLSPKTILLAWRPQFHLTRLMLQQLSKVNALCCCKDGSHVILVDLEITGDYTLKNVESLTLGVYLCGSSTCETRAHIEDAPSVLINSTDDTFSLVVPHQALDDSNDYSMIILPVPESAAAADSQPFGVPGQGAQVGEVYLTELNPVVFTAPVNFSTAPIQSGGTLVVELVNQHQTPLAGAALDLLLFGPHRALEPTFTPTTSLGTWEINDTVGLGQLLIDSEGLEMAINEVDITNTTASDALADLATAVNDGAERFLTLVDEDGTQLRIKLASLIHDGSNGDTLAFGVEIDEGQLFPQGKQVQVRLTEVEESSAGNSTAVTDEDGVVTFRDISFPIIYTLKSEAPKLTRMIMVDSEEKSVVVVVSRK